MRWTARAAPPGLDRPGWISAHIINIVFQVASGARRTCQTLRYGASVAQNQEQRQILEVLSSHIAIGRPFLTAPDVSPARVKALHQAFDDTMKYPHHRGSPGATCTSTRWAASNCNRPWTASGQPPVFIAKVKQAIETKVVESLQKGQEAR